MADLAFCPIRRPLIRPLGAPSPLWGEGSACRKSPFWLFRQAADFFDFIEKVPDCTRKWGLTAPLSHFSPVAYFAWCRFFDSLVFVLLLGHDLSVLLFIFLQVALHGNTELHIDGAALPFQLGPPPHPALPPGLRSQIWSNRKRDVHRSVNVSFGYQEVGLISPPPQRRSGRTAGCDGRRCRWCRSGSSSGGTWGPRTA